MELIGKEIEMVASFMWLIAVIIGGFPIISFVLWKIYCSYGKPYDYSGRDWWFSTVIIIVLTIMSLYFYVYL